jgi:glycosyltransferase involved in cell wall biosynthesis
MRSRYHSGTMRLAIFGARGVPARYGGWDTIVTELAPRLVDAGNEVTLFTMPRYTGSEVGTTYKGVRIVRLPTRYGKFTETLLHELFSSLYALTQRRQDVYYVLGCRAVWAYLPHRILGRTVVFNTDGLDWQRRKWGRFARTYLKLNYWLARRVASHLVSDSGELQKHYRDVYGVESAFLTNGGNVHEASDLERQRSILARYGVEPGGYYLQVCRIEPENNPDIVVREFSASDAKVPLLVVGGANYESEYSEKLKGITDPRVHFLGPVYEPDAIEALYLGARAYIHGHEVGGTNPSLVTALGCGRVVLAHDVRYNREVLGGSGLLWTKDQGSLRARIEEAERHVEALQAQAATAGPERIREFYSWPKCAADHDRFFRWLIGEVPDYADSF